MGQWIRKNLVLIAGIVLPALLVAGFLILQGAMRSLTDPPRYDFLVVGFTYDASHPRDYCLSFEVRDGRLAGRASPDCEDRRHGQQATLYLFEVDDQVFRELVFDLPEGVDGLEEPETFPIEEAAHLKLDKTRRSPDGYVFEYGGHRSRGGLLGELFGYSRRSGSPYVLNRDGEEFPLPEPPGPSRYYGQNLQFLGWVRDSGEGT